jgi:class IV lanthipeptide synthase
VIAPYLKKRDTLFEATKSLTELQKLNAGIFYGFSQVGKFITIYPESTESALVMAEELHALTAGQPAPIVPYDNSLQGNSCVYYRYGGFSKLDVIFRNNKVPAISRSDGKLVRDLRRPGGAVPPWLTDPVQPMHCRPAREALTPLETTYSNYDASFKGGKVGFTGRSIIFCSPKTLCAQGGKATWRNRLVWSRWLHSHQM